MAPPGTLPRFLGYEHFAYTPYGESWVAEDLNQQTTTMTHRFTGQELDTETGLYAFPARYYHPQTSRWLGADPAMGEYLPVAPTSDDARKHNQQLPGMGGVFNYANLVVYHYGANNPLKYVDPTGAWMVELKFAFGPGLSVKFGHNDQVTTFGFDVLFGVTAGASIDLDNQDMSETHRGTVLTGKLEAEIDVEAGPLAGGSLSSKVEATVNPDLSIENTSEAALSYTDPNLGAQIELTLDSAGDVEADVGVDSSKSVGAKGGMYFAIGIETNDEN